MDANIAIAQARGLRRVAADLDRVWDDYLQGNRTADDEKFPAEDGADLDVALQDLIAVFEELPSVFARSVPGA